MWRKFPALNLSMQTKTANKISEIQKTTQISYLRLIRPHQSKMMSFYSYSQAKKRLKKKILGEQKMLMPWVTLKIKRMMRR
jgi:hypothetical protein